MSDEHEVESDGSLAGADATVSTEVSGDAEPDTGRSSGSARRPTPAASAASRARRIGGATAGRPGGSGAEPDAGRPGAGEYTLAVSADDEEQAAGSGRKARLRPVRASSSSARALKAEADDARAVVVQAPAWLRWVPAAVLSACAIAIIVIIAVAAHGVWYAKPSVSAERDKVLAAAKKCMAAVNTYNYTTLAADEQRGLACSTGDWTGQYRNAVDTIVKPTATKLKASQTVQINAAGIESVTGNGAQWTTVIYGQVNLNQTGATPRVDPFGAVVRMQRVGSTYKIAKIDLITQSTS